MIKKIVCGNVKKVCKE